MDIKRYVCFDTEDIKESSGVTLRMHKPVKHDTVFLCDKPWEGNVCCYFCVVKVDDTYRLYYRGADAAPMAEKSNHPSTVCVAETKDGIHFTKPTVGNYEFDGSCKNNIVYYTGEKVDNFSVYLDENPNCPPDEKFKALSSVKLSPDDRRLLYLKSADGYAFELVRTMDIKGWFDSLNIVFWNTEEQQYYLYARARHTVDSDDDEQKRLLSNGDVVRDILLYKSSDFIKWESCGHINYTDGMFDYNMYTNNINRYERGRQFFLAMPTRYVDRPDDTQSLAELEFTDMGVKRDDFLKKNDRTGYAFTDCVLMVSRDGMNFRRSAEPFFSPGIENGRNWVYGDCYFSKGFIETDINGDGIPEELSFYALDGYRSNPPHPVIRYSVRTDGFYSWHADFTGGYAITNPIKAESDTLTLNFKTSALGYIKVSVTDRDGNTLCDSAVGRIFGNSIDRRIKLPVKKGDEISLRFDMCDCELYSFAFI